MAFLIAVATPFTPDYLFWGSLESLPSTHPIPTWSSRLVLRDPVPPLQWNMGPDQHAQLDGFSLFLPFPYRVAVILLAGMLPPWMIAPLL